MIVWAFIDQNGYVLSAGTGSEAPEGATIVSDKLSPAALVQMREVGAAFIARPPAAEITMAGQDVTISNLSTGAQIVVIDLTGSEQMLNTTIASADDVVLTLVDAGEYSIEVTGPLPMFPVSKRVIVTA